MATSDWLEGQLLNHTFRSSFFVKPSTIAVALCLSSPVDADTGATIPEVSNSGGYVRKVLNPSDANWTFTFGNGITSNFVDIVFPVASASWGKITHVALVDSAVYGEGNMLFWGALTTCRIVSFGDTFRFDKTNLQISLD